MKAAIKKTLPLLIAVSAGAGMTWGLMEFGPA